MDDPHKILTEIPLTLNAEERQAIEGFAFNLYRSSDSAPGVMCAIRSEIALALYMVILVGLDAIDGDRCVVVDPERPVG